MLESRKRVMLSLDPDLYDDVSEIAELMETSRSAFIAQILRHEQVTFPKLKQALRAVRAARRTDAMKFFIQAAEAEVERAKQLHLEIQDDYQRVQSETKASRRKKSKRKKKVSIQRRRR